jgi:hypothetical protein
MRFASQEAAAAYLAGIIDGEGHIANRRYQGGSARYVEIINTDPLILEAVADACEQLGITYTSFYRERPGDKNVRSRKPQWSFRISRSQDMEVVQARVPLQSEKAAVLEQALTSYRKTPPYELVKEMAIAGTTGREVAERFGVPMSTAQLWLRKVRGGIVENKQSGRPRGRA